MGLAEHRCRTGGPSRWWLTLSPCLFLAALADPRIFKGLITDGTGGGAIGVTLSGSPAATPYPDVTARPVDHGGGRCAGWVRLCRRTTRAFMWAVAGPEAGGRVDPGRSCGRSWN